MKPEQRRTTNNCGRHCSNFTAVLWSHKKDCNNIVVDELQYVMEFYSFIFELVWVFITNTYALLELLPENTVSAISF